MKKLIVAGLSLGLLAGCGSTEEKTEAKDKPVPKQEVKKETPKEGPDQQKNVVAEAEFITYAKSIKGGNFIKEIKVNNNNAEITYYDSFTAYKSAHADSTTTEEQYKQYFSTGNAIEKLFVGEPARLLRHFHALNSVKMTLPFEGKTYNINLDRNTLNTYLGFKIESLKVDDNSWTNKFNNPYVYTKAKRTEFFKKFVTVK
ncbi:hypothetical protein [Bacillus cereus group sp. MYBK35-2]|uniref:hypothetical protein n=1 Tax=unclassified Bacillus cereus group TaxID=2750818 RepID=UPI0029EE45F3|nr:hypothetical protein [Bacillus cereus]MDA2314617.1 hypothetical protein [Bacillus cereus]MDA2499392.1 hypothetical protein [Bacillus cereus]